jgi:hypothetical protein
MIRGAVMAPHSSQRYVMADNTVVKLFGFELKRTNKEVNKKPLPSIVPPLDDDGAGYITASGSHYGQYIDFDGDNSKDSIQLLQRYRAVAGHPEVDMAIDEIVNETISTSEMEANVKLNLDKIEGLSDKVKKTMQEEFDEIVTMLNFTELGSDIYKRWYVDGKMFHHLIVDETKPALGIQEIRPIDATKIRKVKQVKKKKDEKTGAPIVEKIDEFYIYEEKPGQSNTAIKISPDSINYVTSGLLDERRAKVVSYLHKALKPINQLRMMEDSLVIYRLARAPERRIFYVDVGNLPRGKAEQYMKDIMTRYKNKIVYDASTGEIKDDRKHMSMLEDFWLPRREGGKGTEITTLPGGENLGQIDDIIYFQKKLYRALNVPVNRLEQEAQFSLGRSSEISRDELKFQKFIDRLRRRFSKLFLEILKKQLILKKIITDDDWEEWRSDIVIDFIRDNHFTELKEAEILNGRLATLNDTNQFIGEYFSREWVMKNVLRFDDEEIEDMKKQMTEERAAGELPPLDIPEQEPAQQNEPAQAPEPEEDNEG